MSKRLHRTIAVLAAGTALTGALTLGVGPSFAAGQPNVSCGTLTSADTTAAAGLNQVLTGKLRNGAMTAYRFSCARAIVDAVRARGLSDQLAVIAVTTAITESVLENNPNQIDFDSVGLFQQRASWGSTSDRLSPAISTNLFLNRLLNLYPNNSWQSKQVGVVCQSVQVSAYPDRYQGEVADAQRIVNAVGAASTTPPNPLSLPAGTLVKSAAGPDVKVMIAGAGIPVAAADVGADHYDLSRIVLVDDTAFRSLPGVPPAGTVVLDQSGGGASRYVVVDGAALPVSGTDWTADGYNTRPALGVPTSWLQNARQGSLSSGLVVSAQSGTDPSRYVMVDGAALPISGAEWTTNGYDSRPLMGVPTDWLHAAAARTPGSGTVVKNISGTDPSVYVMLNGAALPISGAEWTADGYDTRPLMGVPGTWLQSAAAKSPTNGTVVMNQSGTDPSRYVMVAGAALPISGTEWTAAGYNTRPLMGAPGTWLQNAAATSPANGTVVKNISGTDPSIYVIAGGAAVPLTGTDFTTLGYDQQPLLSVPGTWEQNAVAKPAPAQGTLLLSPNDPTVWLVTATGQKKALTPGDFGPGKYNLTDAVKVPTTYTTKLPTTT
ncbi:hypothetical protein [Kitasatospora sp. NPDC057015]|uniref:hypothetical protein n=1 Tax=Kitasatospora sp. NPDC057015 TaxID=3346001 RepID=UPI00362A7E21